MKLETWKVLCRRHEEPIASFGQAQLVRTPDGKYELQGGSPEDQQAAREWISLFLHEAFPRVRA